MLKAKGRAENGSPTMDRVSRKMIDDAPRTPNGVPGGRSGLPAAACSARGIIVGFATP